MRSKAIVAAAAIAGLMRGAFAATSHAAVSIGKPGVSLQAGRWRATSTLMRARTPAKVRAAVKISTFFLRAYLDNAVTEARIPQ